MKVLNLFNLFSLMAVTVAKANETLQQNKTVKTTTDVVKDRSVTEEKTKHLKSENLPRQSISLWPNIEEDQDLLLLEQVLQDIERG